MKQAFAMLLIVPLPFQAHAASLSPLTEAAPVTLSAPAGKVDHALDEPIFGHTSAAGKELGFMGGPVLGNNPMRAILPPDQWARPDGVTPNVLIRAR